MRYRIRKVARSAVNGRFVSQRTALWNRATTVVETYRIPTYGRSAGATAAVARRRRRRPNRQW